MNCELTIEREILNNESTIGSLFINEDFFCYTLEDTDRGLDSSMSVEQILKIKKPGKTAIPIGSYDVKILMSPRFKKLFPKVLNVKGFDGILFHAGNAASDTDGCILVGTLYEHNKILESRPIFKELMDKLRKYDKITLKITRP